MHYQQYFESLALERVITTVTLRQFDGAPAVDIVQVQKQRHLRLKLQRIEAALQRLVAGRYGLCQACLLEIDPERLQTLPYTELCVCCQRKLEKQTIGYRPAVGAAHDAMSR